MVPTMENLFEVAKRPLVDLAPDISDALVYLDAGAGEVAYACWGISLLLGLGAAHVCDLESATPEDGELAMLLRPELSAPPTVVAYFITQLLTDTHTHILKSVEANPTATRLLIFSSLSQHAHACHRHCMLNVEAYSEYAEVLKGDVRMARSAGNQFPIECSVDVRHFPMDMSVLDPATFVLPAAGAAARFARSGDLAAGYGPAVDDGDDGDGEGASGGLSLLAHTLAAIGGQLGARLEPFALGPVAQKVAQEVASLPIALPPVGAGAGGGPVASASGDGSTGAGVRGSSMALLLIDRSLDLVSVAGHSDHPLDLVLDLLRPGPVPWRGERRSGDDAGGSNAWRGLNMMLDNPSCSSAADAAIPATGLVPGPALGPASPALPSLPLEVLQPDERRGVAMAEALVQRRGRDAALVLRKWLKDALRAEKLVPPQRSRAAVTPAELAALSRALLEQPGTAMRQRAALGFGAAAAAALGSAAAPRWEAAAALEAQVAMTMRDSPADVGACVLDALGSIAQGKGLLTVTEGVCLLAYTYSLAGESGRGGPPLTGDEERTARSLLLDAILAAQAEDLWWLPVAQEGLTQLQSLPPGDADTERRGLRLALGDLLDSFLLRLTYVSTSRSRLKDLRTLAGPAADLSPTPVLQPLLRAVAARVLTGSPLSDLTAATSALRGLLSMGLGRLGLAAKAPSVSDYPGVILFVLGGLGAAEAREVRQRVAETMGPRPRLYIGGTALITPTDVCRQLLA